MTGGNAHSSRGVAYHIIREEIDLPGRAGAIGMHAHHLAQADARDGSRKLLKRMDAMAEYPATETRAPLTFAEQIALVESGKLRIVEVQPIQRPEPAWGGSSLA